MWADATPTRGRVALLPKALIKQVVQVFGCRDIRAVVSFWASSSVYERSGVGLTSILIAARWRSYLAEREARAPSSAFRESRELSRESRACLNL